jgi:hypothetical protein
MSTVNVSVGGVPTGKGSTILSNKQSGGGGSGGVAVDQDGESVVDSATVLDFQSPGTLVADGGDGFATIWATLLPVIVPPLIGAVYQLAAGQTNIVTATDEATQGVFPAASSVPNGTPLIVKMFVDGNEGEEGDDIELIANGEDTLDGSNPFEIPLSLAGQALVWVSDGDSAWSLVADWLPTGAGIGVQIFRYTADGSEGDDFVLGLPNPQPDTDFNAWVTGGGLTNDLTFQVVVADNELTTIHVKTSGPLTAGDVLLVETSPQTV